MKNIISTILFTLTITSCKSQNPILPLDGGNTTYGSTKGAYYKDLNNFLNQYEGTWLLDNGTTTLKIVLTKKVMFHKIAGLKQYYSDYIVGEYLYIENGIEKLNTLNNLQTDHTNIYNYGLVGNSQMPKDIYPKCNECATDEKRLNMKIFEPIVKDVEGLGGEMIARKYTENGIEKLKIWFIPKGSSYGVTKEGKPTSITKHTIPYGEYILVKQ